MKKNRLAMAVSAVAVGGFSGLAHGQLIAPSTTTYEFTSINQGTLGDNGTAPQIANEALRTASFGSGQLNDTFFGNTTWLSGAGSTHAYQFEYNTTTSAGQLGGDYFHAGGSGTTVAFNLGASYNLGSVTLGLVDDDASGVSVPQTVTISDGVHTVVSTTYANQPSGALPGVTYSTQNLGQHSGYGGAYISETIDLSAAGLSGENITINFLNTDWDDTQGNTATVDNTGGWVGLNEVEFTAASAVPEPASLSLLGLGALGLLGRRRSQKA